MMKRWVGAVLLGLWAGAGQGEERFDHWVLALSWSPTWCAGAGRGEAAQCTEGRRFVLHGLWPQSGASWPEDCRSRWPDPSRAETRAMADIMGSSGLAFHEWQEHGRCTGLSAAAYFALSRRAFGAVTVPPVLMALRHEVRLPASVIEAAFLEVNPGFVADGVTVTCEGEAIDEVRLCLDMDLTPRPCEGAARRDCALPGAVLPAPQGAGQIP